MAMTTGDVIGELRKRLAALCDRVNAFFSTAHPNRVDGGYVQRSWVLDDSDCQVSEGLRSEIKALAGC